MGHVCGPVLARYGNGEGRGRGRWRQRWGTDGRTFARMASSTGPAGVVGSALGSAVVDMVAVMRAALAGGRFRTRAMANRLGASIERKLCARQSWCQLWVLVYRAWRLIAPARMFCAAETSSGETEAETRGV